MEENKGYVARIIFNYNNMLDEKIIQEGYMTALEIKDVKMFLAFYNKSEIKFIGKVEPKSNIVGLMRQLAKQKDGEKFSDLLKKFE